MKNSVNGKTFDEIFGQRGRKTTKMVKGCDYLILCVDGDLWLFTFNGILGRLPNNIGCLTPLCDDGTCYNVQKNMGFEPSDFDHAFKATPDQIALLNSYKQ